MQDSVVYDLGEVDLDDAPPLRPVPAPPERTRPPLQAAASTSARPVSPGVRPRRRWPSTRQHGPRFDVAGSLSLLLPGTGHLVRGEVASGLFFITWIGLAVTCIRAVLLTLPGLSDLLALLGTRPEVAVWTLGALLGSIALLHLGSVATYPRDLPGRAHPAVAGVMSGLVPGWGQILNGDRWRAVAFTAGVWTAAVAWLLAAPALSALLDSRDLVYPEAFRWWASPLVRWTLPAVVWTLGVYDAVARARRS